MKRILWIGALAVALTLSATAGAQARESAGQHRVAARTAKTTVVAMPATAASMNAQACPVSDPSQCGKCCPGGSAGCTSASAVTAATTAAAKPAFRMNGRACPVSDPSSCPASCPRSSAIAAAVKDSHR